MIFTPLHHEIHSKKDESEDYERALNKCEIHMRGSAI
jgi:hypothetical protein